jgi:hypothetical protein
MPVLTVRRGSMMVLPRTVLQIDRVRQRLAWLMIAVLVGHLALMTLPFHVQALHPGGVPYQRVTDHPATDRVFAALLDHLAPLQGCGLVQARPAPTSLTPLVTIAPGSWSGTKRAPGERPHLQRVWLIGPPLPADPQSLLQVFRN